MREEEGVCVWMGCELKSYRPAMEDLDVVNEECVLYWLSVVVEEECTHGVNMSRQNRVKLRWVVLEMQQQIRFLLKPVEGGASACVQIRGHGAKTRVRGVARASTSLLTTQVATGGQEHQLMCKHLALLCEQRSDKSKRHRSRTRVVWVEEDDNSPVGDGMIRCERIVIGVCVDRCQC